MLCEAAQSVKQGSPQDRETPKAHTARLVACCVQNYVGCRSCDTIRLAKSWEWRTFELVDKAKPDTDRNLSTVREFQCLSCRWLRWGAICCARHRLTLLLDLWFRWCHVHSICNTGNECEWWQLTEGLHEDEMTESSRTDYRLPAWPKCTAAAWLQGGSVLLLDTAIATATENLLPDHKKNSRSVRRLTTPLIAYLHSSSI